MSLSYSIKEGIAAFRRARFSAVASTSAAAIALVMIGLFGLLWYEAAQISNWLKQRVGEVEIFLEEQADASTAETLHRRASVTSGVAEAEYISQQEAQDVFMAEFGEGGEAFLDDLFLPASIRVRVDASYANPDSLEQLVATFGEWNRVQEVVFNQPLLVMVQQNLRVFSIAGLTLGGLVVLASVFLVANTIRLTIYSRRLLIRTMKLVGATDGFIRRPFIIEGLLQGIIAGVIASLLLIGIYSLMISYLPQLASPGWRLYAAVFAGVTSAGALLGWAGSYFAVRRFIKNVALH